MFPFLCRQIQLCLLHVKFPLMNGLIRQGEFKKHQEVLEKVLDDVLDRN